MSQQSAMDFAIRAAQDRSVWESVVNEVTKDHGEVDQTDLNDSHFESATRAGRAAGYDFTPQELKTAFSQLTAPGSGTTARQLSDAELDLVAGGGDQPTNTEANTGSAKS